MTSQEFRNYIEKRKGNKEQIEKSISQIKENNDILTKKLHKLEQSREIIRIVGIDTQKHLQYHISDITSLAIESVYDDPYELVARFIEKRNKSECELLFTRNGQEMEPMEASGGGVINIASFALRVASWSMQNPKSNNVLILDEPFGNIQLALLPRVSQMLQDLSRKLSLQIIMVTHSEELIDEADKVFYISIKKGRSQINERN